MKLCLIRCAMNPGDVCDICGRPAVEAGPDGNLCEKHLVDTQVGWYELYLYELRSRDALIWDGDEVDEDL